MALVKRRANRLKWCLALAALVAMSMFAPAAAQAQPEAQVQAKGQTQAQARCGDRQNFVRTLERKYSEKPVSIGLTESGGVFELFVSPSGTWTILVTVPGGKSCYLASGEGWENLPSSVAGSKI